MECPACGGQLHQLMAGDIELDACTEGCGGVWFDRDELFKFDEAHEFDGHPILKLAKEKAAVHVDQQNARCCPKCPGEPLVRQFLDIKNEVAIDQCWNCSGVWLDPGELNSIRAQYKNFAERSAVVNQYVDAQLQETKKVLQQHTAEQLARYNAETSNRFTAALHAIKRVLCLDGGDDVL